MNSKALLKVLLYLAWIGVAFCQNCDQRGYNSRYCHGTAPFCEGIHAQWPDDVTIFNGDRQVVEACNRHDGDDNAAHREFPQWYRQEKEDLERRAPGQFYFCDWRKYQYKGALVPFMKNGNCRDGSSCWSGNKRLTCYNQYSCNVDRCLEQQGDDDDFVGMRITGIHAGTRPPKGHGYSNTRILQDLQEWRGFHNGAPRYCFCLYEKTFDNFEGSWDHVATLDRNAEFSRTLTVGTSLTSGESLTQKDSTAISVSVGAKFKFFNAQVTGTVSQTTAHRLSTAITTSQTESCSSFYPRADELGYNFLQVYQFSMRGYDRDGKKVTDTKSCSTYGLYTKTQESFYPRCPLGDCKDELCQTCISGDDYESKRLLRGLSSTGMSSNSVDMLNSENYTAVQVNENVLLFVPNGQERHNPGWNVARDSKSFLDYVAHLHEINDPSA